MNKKNEILGINEFDRIYSEYLHHIDPLVGPGTDDLFKEWLNEELRPKLHGLFGLVESLEAARTGLRTAQHETFKENDTLKKLLDIEKRSGNSLRAQLNESDAESVDTIKAELSVDIALSDECQRLHSKVKTLIGVIDALLTEIT